MTPTEFRFHILELFLWCVRVLAVLAALAVVYFIVTSLAWAADVECRSEHDGKGGWAWRHVEPYPDKRCWYRGTRLIPKSELHWRGAVVTKYKPGHMRENPPGLGSRNYLKLARPSRDASGNVAHLSGTPIEVPTKNEIDEMSDTLPVRDVVENSPFGPWEERVGGQFK